MISSRSLVVVGLAALCLFLMVTGHTEAASIVGMAFSPSSSSAPTNWTHVDSMVNGGGTISNLIDETGKATSISLQFSVVPATNTTFFPVTLNTSTVPMHTPSLTLNGNFENLGSTAPFTAVLSGLAPSSPYDIWVFAARQNTLVSQNVTIQGGGAPIFFSQTAQANQVLVVNGAVGSNALPLESYADVMRSSSSGTITITVTGFSGTSGASFGVSGIALESIPEPSSLVLVCLGLVSLGVFVGVRRRFRRCAA
jgi:hypothetical protein